MSGRNTPKHARRRETGGFSLIPHAVQDSENWRNCSATAKAMLLELVRQSTGLNNGDFCAAFSMMRKRGWKSPETVHFALCELRHYGFVTLTRQGGLHQASLYAVTWWPVDRCGGKLDITSTTMPSRAWKHVVAKYRRPRKVKLPLRRTADGITPTVSKAAETQRGATHSVAS